MGEYMNFLFNPNGRVSRKDIWLKYLLVSVIVGTVAGRIDTAFGLAEVQPVGNLVSLFFFWPGIAVAVKRFHDRGMTGWWVLFIYLGVLIGFLLALYPFLGLILENLDDIEALDATDIEGALEGSGVAIMLIGALTLFGTVLFSFIVNYCLAGEAGPNKYGPDPLNPTLGTADTFT